MICVCSGKIRIPANSLKKTQLPILLFRIYRVPPTYEEQPLQPSLLHLRHRILSFLPAGSRHTLSDRACRLPLNAGSYLFRSSDFYLQISFLCFLILPILSTVFTLFSILSEIVNIDKYSLLFYNYLHSCTVDFRS